MSITFRYTSVKKLTREKVDAGTHKPVHPQYLPASAADTVEQNGFYAIPYPFFCLLYRMKHGTTLSREEIASKADFTDLLGVDLSVSPHAVIKMPSADNPQEYEIAVVKSDPASIKSSNRAAGTRKVKDKYLISVKGAITAAVNRWGKTTNDLTGILLSDYNVRRRRFKGELPIVYDFSDVPISNGEGNEWEQLQFLVSAMHGDESKRLSAENITYKPVSV